MFSFAKNTVKKSIAKMASKSPELWKIQTLTKLRYKFDALRVGIERNKAEGLVLFNLRRNIHRLEKGLCHPSPKAVFAEDYIVETVRAFGKGLANDELDDNTLPWASSVLSLYFDVVAETPTTGAAKRQFNQIKSSLTELQATDHVPYPSSQRPALSASYEALLNLSVRRRSVRYFHEQPPAYELVQRAYEIAKYAPSACNRQSFQFLFYNDKQIVDQLSAIPGGVTGYSLPGIIVVVGRYDGYFDIRDINAPIIDASLSIMSFLFAAETLGLGTVCINWPNLLDREQRIRKLLDIKPYEFVIMMIGIGYPLDSGKIPYSGKRPKEGVLLYNERIKPS